MKQQYSSKSLNKKDKKINFHSKLLTSSFTEFINKNELKYRNNIQPYENEYNQTDKWVKTINDGRRNILPILTSHIDFKGNILEVGAGSCWFSSELSRISSVKKVYSLEMSEHILKNIAPSVMLSLNANTHKIVRIIGDFHKLHFPDSFFDFIVFDASMHHIPTETFSIVMKEICRVLKNDGTVVAIREPFLSPIPFFNINQKNQFGSHEKKFGVTENIFEKKKFVKLLKKQHFKIYFKYYGFEKKDKSVIKHCLKTVIYSNIFKEISASLLNYPCIIIIKKDKIIT
ncbi:MAG: class I SAM-dependent methyltransferase [Candidatus Woesearchaeota archaeon]|jgi:ubiquinone/menaquinone biosynthesis C-methylase UbiE